MLGFTILLTVFLFEGLNWNELLNNCYSEESCRTVKLIRPMALVHPSPFLVLYFSVFSLYWVWTLVHFVWDLRPLLEIRALFRDKLHIDDAMLQVTTMGPGRHSVLGGKSGSSRKGGAARRMH